MPINQELKNNSSNSDSSNGKPKTIIVKIENLQVNPKYIRMVRYGTVKFLIGKNSPEYDTEIYQNESRVFYLQITDKHKNICAESPRLVRGHLFSYTFGEVGEFKMQC